MKQILIVAVLLTIVASCRPFVNHQLDLAESLMDSKPDSAFRVLEKINDQDLFSRESKARYSLLKSMVYDKNYIDIKNDSLIR